MTTSYPLYVLLESREQGRLSPDHVSTALLRKLFISDSDSPAMDSTLVDMRAYSGCGKDTKNRKFARKHVYIQKRLVDDWIKACSESSQVGLGQPGGILCKHFHRLEGCSFMDTLSVAYSPS